MKESQSRNKKCSCGSGKNYKNCCMKKTRKKRFSFITYEAKEEHADENGVISMNLFIDGINGKLDVLNSKTDESFLKDGSKLKTGYFRQSGKPKILSEIPSVDGHHYTDVVKQILKYDRLVAIDTNTYKDDDDKIISIGIGHQVFGFPSEEGYQYHYIPIARPFIIHGYSEKPENQNWMNLLKFITAHENHDPQFKIGLIVDSDLGNIPSFNQREKPIFEDYFLPENFELVFASDAANDSFLNQAIKKCHSLANEAYKFFCKKKE